MANWKAAPRVPSTMVIPTRAAYGLVVKLLDWVRFINPWLHDTSWTETCGISGSMPKRCGQMRSRLNSCVGIQMIVSEREAAPGDSVLEVGPCSGGLRQRPAHSRA